MCFTTVNRTINTGDPDDEFAIPGTPVCTRVCTRVCTCVYRHLFLSVYVCEWVSAIDIDIGVSVCDDDIQ